MQLLESIFIVIALVSLAPLVWGLDAPWYRVWLVLVLASMVWVAVRRLGRTRAAAEEARRKREAGGRPPMA